MNHSSGEKATISRRSVDLTEEEFNFIFGTACTFYKGKWPTSLKRRIGSFNKHPPSKMPDPDDDWLIVRNFNPSDLRQVRDWAIYMSQGLDFASDHFKDQDPPMQRQIKAILDTCVITCQNIRFSYDERKKQEDENLKNAQKKLGREQL
jgi:hypothetical protein